MQSPVTVTDTVFINNGLATASNGTYYIKAETVGRQATTTFNNFVAEGNKGLTATSYFDHFDESNEVTFNGTLVDLLFHLIIKSM